MTNFINNYLAYPDSDYHRKKLKHGNNATWQRMYSRTYIERIGVKYEEIPACNDGWFVQYASSQTNHIAAIPKKLYYYVKTPNSIVNGTHSKEIELQRIEAGFRIHKLLAKENAYCAIPPFLKGTKKCIKRYGVSFTLYCIMRKLISDVSPIKLVWFSIKQKSSCKRNKD